MVRNISHSLPKGTILNNTYEIQTVIGEGGFGITYVARDLHTQQIFAIKEYFPTSTANRVYFNDDWQVSHGEGELASSFAKGLHRFEKEARILQSMNHMDAIVKVMDIFLSHGTAYYVMEYIEGFTLMDYVAEHGTLAFEELIPLMQPVMSALNELHRYGVIHRDISPDNLVIGLDNRIHLIDFGSITDMNLNQSHEVTVLLKNGFAPPEQYLDNGKIGPWTDVYGIAATIYFALTGRKPLDALHRSSKDTLNIKKEITALNERESIALEKALNLEISLRYRSVKQFYLALTEGMEEIQKKKEGKQTSTFHKLWLLLLLLSILILFYFWNKNVIATRQNHSLPVAEQTTTSGNATAATRSTQQSATTTTHNATTESGTKASQDTAVKSAANSDGNTAAETEPSSGSASTPAPSKTTAATNNTKKTNTNLKKEKKKGNNTTNNSQKTEAPFNIKEKDDGMTSIHID